MSSIDSTDPPAFSQERPLAGKRILLVSNGFQGNYERGFSNGLLVAGADLELISSDKTDYAGLLPGVQTRNLRGSQNASRPAWRKLVDLCAYHSALMVKVICARGRTVHVFGLTWPLWPVGVVEGALLRVFARRYVLTVHNLVPHDTTSQLTRLACWLSYRFPHKLVVHTARMREELVRDFGLSRGRVIVMEHGLEPVSVASESRDAEHVNDGRIRLLFFGYVAPYKGLNVLLDAFTKLGTNVELEIVGSAHQASYGNTLRELIDLHPAAKRISWHREYVDERDVHTVFARADVLVLPYLHIDQSGVLFQAFRFGVPVVATRVGAFEDYVTHEIGELCEPASAEALRVAIESLIARLPTLSSERIASVGMRYEWPRAVAALRDAY